MTVAARIPQLRTLLSATLMKNCAVAESGFAVRAMAMVPTAFFSPPSTPPRASFGIAARVGFCRNAPSKPPPWIMKPLMTR